MDKMQLNLDDLNFIFSEIIRFKNMSSEERKSHFRDSEWDALCLVPHPSGKGKLICGLAAYRRFLQIAKRHLSGHKQLEKQIRADVFRDAIIHDFSNRFLKRGDGVNRDSVGRMLSSAIRHIQSKLVSLIHYIPCVIIEDATPEEFVVGPVRFILMTNFIQQQEEYFKIEQQRLTQEHIKLCQKAVKNGYPEDQVYTAEQSKEFAHSLVDTVVKNFSGYSWIAEVMIPECDKKTSILRAEIVVEGALNILRLMLGEEYSKKIRKAYSPGSCIEKAILTKDDNNKFNFSISKSFGQGESHGTNWFNHIYDNYNSFISAAGSSLKGITEPYNCSHLQQRFLDALMWYGQGVMELLPAAQVVKYVLALERITAASKEDDKANTNAIAKRIKLLCSDSDDLNWEKDVKKIYDVRSRLVHGDYSPLSEELSNKAALAEKITRMTLFKALSFYLSINQKNKKANANDLDEEFKLLDRTKNNEKP